MINLKLSYGNVVAIVLVLFFWINAPFFPIANQTQEPVLVNINSDYERIRELENQLSSREELIFNLLTSGVPDRHTQDSLITRFERSTQLYRLRDSLEGALRQKYRVK